MILKSRKRVLIHDVKKENHLLMKVFQVLSGNDQCCYSEQVNCKLLKVDDFGAFLNNKQYTK